VVVGDERGVLELESRLLGERSEPVVGVAFAEGEAVPVIGAGDLRAVVGTRVAIYLIPYEAQLEHLRRRLGHFLALNRGGVRIWWPGLSRKSKTIEHPHIFAAPDEPRESFMAEFTRRYVMSHPVMRREIETLEDLSAQTEQRLEKAERAHQRTRMRLQDRDRDLRVERRRREGLEAQMREMEQHWTERSFEERLHSWITSLWLAKLTPEQRREHPLQPYVLSTEFLGLTEERWDLREEQLAWACAMVACDCVESIGGLRRAPLVAQEGGEQLVRDGAQGWWVSLDRKPDSPRMHYWVHQDGVIHFTAVASPDDRGHGEQAEG
jgi:hypothetical protein